MSIQHASCWSRRLVSNLLLANIRSYEFWRCQPIYVIDRRLRNKKVVESIHASYHYHLLLKDAKITIDL